MTTTAAREGLIACDSCYLLNREEPAIEHPACARCGAPLHMRKPASLTRSWAFLIAAALLYIPANLLPVLETNTLGDSTTDTIYSGVIHLWQTGSWLLAAIVFVASLVIPLAKLVSMSYLLFTAQRHSTRNLHHRAWLYRATHYIGRWSMVDIYVGAVLVALVQLKAFASVEPGPGAIFFAAVVILTMIASMSFDPRLTWDPIDEPAHE